MTDLLDDGAVADFMDAMRDVSDTFLIYPVTVEVDGQAFALTAGLKRLENDLSPQQGGEEIAERYAVRFNWAYLEENALVAQDTLLIDHDSRVIIDGLTFFVAGWDVKTFRDRKLLVILTVVR